MVRTWLGFHFENVTYFKEATKVGKGTQTHHRTFKSLVIYKDNYVRFQFSSFGKLSLFVKWKPFYFLILQRF
jgi:hypothetical protein